MRSKIEASEYKDYILGFMTLEVVDLPATFEVLSFGVVEDGGVDKLRLVIRSLPEIFTCPS